MVMLGIVVSSSKSCQDSGEQVTKELVASAMWLILVSLLFFLIPSCLCTSELCRFLGRKKADLSCSAPKAGEAGHSLLSFSGQRELLIVGEFLCQSGV